MENTGGRQNFIIGIDNQQLLADAQKCKDLLASIGTEAVQQGSLIDRAFGESGAAKQFTVLEAAIRGASSEIKDIEFGSVEEKIGALSHIIRENENILAANVQQLEKWKKDAQEAFESGDTGALAAINQDIDEQVEKIRELSEETEGYRNILQAVLAESGMGGGAANVPMLFNNEEEMQRLEELKAKIIETQAEISRLGAEDGDTTQLTLALSEMKDELNECEQGAASAAAALGGDLGARASEAQQNLYMLDTAITEQQSVIDNLASALEEARTKYEEVQASSEASSNEVAMAAATYDTLSQSLANAQIQMSALQGAQQQAQAQWKNVSNEIQAHDSVLVKMLGGYQNYSSIVGGLPAPIQSVVKGITGMTGAAKAFIATPLGAIIAAIVIALQAMRKWLNSSVEGQLRLAEITGYISGVLGQLKEIVIGVGKSLFKAFDDPKKAISDLWQAIKTNVVNRFKAIGDIAAALGKVIKAAFTFDKDGIKEGLKELSESFVQFGTGVDNAGEKLGRWVKGVGEKAKEQSKINRETRELEIEMSKWQIERENIEQQKAEERGKMYNSSLSAGERKKAMDNYKALLNQQLEQDRVFADKKVELQERTMALTTNSIEDENKLRKLQAERAAVDTRAANELATLERRAGMITNKGMSEENAAIRESERQAKALTDLGDLQAEILIRNQEKQLAIMDEGHAKNLKQIEIAKQEEEQKTKDLEDKFKKLNTEGKVEVGEDGLTDSQRKQITEAKLLTEAKYAKDMERLLQEELSGILTYEQTRTEIQKQFEEKRAALYEEDGKTLKQGVTQGNIDELDYQRDEALAAVDEQFAAREITYQEWCNTIASQTLNNLIIVLEQAKTELAKLEQDPNADPNKLAEARAKVNTAEKAVSQKKAEEATSPGKRTLEEWKDLYDVLNDCKGAFDDIGDAVGGVAGEIISTAGDMLTSAISMINGIVQLANWSAISMKMTAEGASSAIQAVEKASVILTIISTALQVTMAIVNLVKSNAQKEAQKKMEDLQARVDALEKSYDKLGRAIEEAYSKDASKLIEQSNELLRKQKEAIMEQKRLEEDKKKKDEKAIRELQDKYDELDERMSENQQKAVDAIFGNDVRAAIEDFAEAYADAWGEGESRAKSTKETVRKMMQEMVNESVKAAIKASGAMDQIRSKLQQFYADGVLSDWEQQYVYNMGEELQRQINEQFGWADSLMKGLTDREGSSKGITSASQSTVDELNGRATAIQGHTFSIAESTRNLVSVTSSILSSVLRIEDHTEKISDRMDAVEAAVKETRSTVSDIYLKGVKMK